MASKRVLIVEDDEEAVIVLESRLKARGYAVDSAMNFDEVLKLIARTPPDMVLVGLALWKKHASDLCERIRGSLGSSTTSIILMAEEADIASLIMSLELGVDDFILKPFSAIHLQLRVALNFRRNEERIQANPLTKLPGNIAIEQEIRRRIEQNETFAVCYIDIDNFKAFNDAYGFDRGDDVLLQTANIIRRSADLLGPKAKVFVGHIGGDDFLVMLDIKYDQPFARECIKEFDRVAPTYYKSEDQERGTISVKNRKGRTAKFPLMTLSIASISDENRRFEGPAHVAQIAAEVKSFLKTQPGSNFLQDRRNRPLHDLETALDVLGTAKGDKRDEPEHEPLGQVLRSAGLITGEQLTKALDRHFKTGQRLGQVLIGMNLCRSEDVGRMLERKLGVRYMALRRRRLRPAVVNLFTEEYVRTHRVCAIEIKNGRLYLAMLDPFDIKTVDYIERITGYKVVPCIALEQEFEDFLEKNFPQEEDSPSAVAREDESHVSS